MPDLYPYRREVKEKKSRQIVQDFIGSVKCRKGHGEGLSGLVYSIRVSDVGVIVSMTAHRDVQKAP